VTATPFWTLGETRTVHSKDVTQQAVQFW